MTSCKCMRAGQALQGAAEAWSDLSGRALAAPAGVLGTLGVTVSTLPRILLGDALAAYRAASQALANLETAGACPALPVILAWVSGAVLSGTVLSSDRCAFCRDWRLQPIRVGAAACGRPGCQHRIDARRQGR